MQDRTNLYEQAARQLSANDPHLAPIIAQVGLCTIQPNTDYYHDLVTSIIGQQLSVKAARTIRGRFMELFDGAIPTPAQIIATEPDVLRSVGLSGQKTKYIRDLAEHVLDGRIVFHDIDSLDNEEIIARLTDVKGIGEWTVHMFLMFVLGRTDVLAHGDLGVRNGVRKVYGLAHLPSPDDMRAISDKYRWHPYESIACWYMWQFLDNEPAS